LSKDRTVRTFGLLYYLKKDRLGSRILESKEDTVITTRELSRPILPPG